MFEDAETTASFHLSILILYPQLSCWPPYHFKNYPYPPSTKKRWNHTRRRRFRLFLAHERRSAVVSPKNVSQLFAAAWRHSLASHDLFKSSIKTNDFIPLSFFSLIRLSHFFLSVLNFSLSGYANGNSFLMHSINLNKPRDSLPARIMIHDMFAFLK